MSERYEEKCRKEYKPYIIIGDKYIEVSEEVYKEYRRMERREQYLAERDKKNDVVSYHALDGENMNGEELFVGDAPSIEDIIILCEERKILYQAIISLNTCDRALIKALYFDEQTEQQVAQQLGIRHQNVHKRKVRILRKLKKFFANWNREC